MYYINTNWNNNKLTEIVESYISNRVSKDTKSHNRSVSSINKLRQDNKSFIMDQRFQPILMLAYLFDIQKETIINKLLDALWNLRLIKNKKYSEATNSCIDEITVDKEIEICNLMRKLDLGRLADSSSIILASAYLQDIISGDQLIADTFKSGYKYNLINKVIRDEVDINEVSKLTELSQEVDLPEDVGELKSLLYAYVFGELKGEIKNEHQLLRIFRSNITNTEASTLRGLNKSRLLFNKLINGNAGRNLSDAFNSMGISFNEYYPIVLLKWLIAGNKKMPLNCDRAIELMSWKGNSYTRDDVYLKYVMYCCPSMDSKFTDIYNFCRGLQSFEGLLPLFENLQREINLTNPCEIATKLEIISNFFKLIKETITKNITAEIKMSACEIDFNQLVQCQPNIINEMGKILDKKEAFSILVSKVKLSSTLDQFLLKVQALTPIQRLEYHVEGLFEKCIEETKKVDCIKLDECNVCTIM